MTASLCIQDDKRVPLVIAYSYEYTGTKVTLQTGTLCEYACGEKQMST